MGKAFYFLRPANTPLRSVYVGLRHSEGQFLLSTGIKVSGKHWNARKSEVKNVALPELDLHPSILIKKLKEEDIISFTNGTLYNIAAFVNERLHLDRESIKAELNSFIFEKNEVETLVFDLHRFCMDYLQTTKAPTKENLLTNIESFLHPAENQHCVFDYIEKFISDSLEGKRLNGGKRIAYKTVQRYRTTQKLLHDFQDVTGFLITFDNIDKDFIDRFNSFMAKKKNYSVATMGKHVQTFKSFLTEATEDGINTNEKFRGKSFATKKVTSDSIHMTESELKTMYEIDLSGNERLEKVRDLFIVGAYTGLRISDFMDIKPENIKRDKQGCYFEKIQFKVKEKVIIPLNDLVIAILKKYDNELPSISDQKFNKYIKEVAFLVPQLHEIHEQSITNGGVVSTKSSPKYELISGHTARRSFATNAYERGVPTLSIMAMTGHHTESAFLGYIKTSKSKHADIFRSYESK